jgi:hypothetical protein
LAYPDLSLAKAREPRDEARRLLADQIDPSARRKAERLAQADTFEGIAREWLELQRHGLSEKTFLRKLGWLEDFLFPYLGRHPIAKITRPICWLRLSELRPPPTLPEDQCGSPCSHQICLELISHSHDLARAHA